MSEEMTGDQRISHPCNLRIDTRGLDAIHVVHLPWKILFLTPDGRILAEEPINTIDLPPEQPSSLVATPVSMGSLWCSLSNLPPLPDYPATLGWDPKAKQYKWIEALQPGGKPRSAGDEGRFLL